MRYGLKKSNMNEAASGPNLLTQINGIFEKGMRRPAGPDAFARRTNRFSPRCVVVDVGTGAWVAATDLVVLVVFVADSQRIFRRIAGLG